MIYEGGTLNQILIDGGYVTFSGTTPVYHYYLKDHQGNNRVVVNKTGTVEEVNHYYPFGLLFGESINPDTQRFKYNGKELDMMHGLHMYDYGARQYDPLLCRFTTMDPMCEKYYHLSPYAYCGNNPVNYVDPTGKLILYAKGVSETFKKDFEKTTQMLKEKGCGNMLDRLNNSKIVFYIAENNKDSNSFNSSTNTISWNPRKGLYTNKDAFLSPATRLNHELGHAVNYLDDPQEYHKNIETQIEGDDETYTVEEKNVIEGIESETAISLGEINQGETTRNDHNGVTFDTDSPLSNKPINRFEVIILNKPNIPNSK